MAAFVITVAQASAVVVAILVVDKFGRKFMLTSSNLLMCLSLASLGIFFYLDENKSQTYCQLKPPTEINGTETCFTTEGTDPDLIDSLGWLPLVSLIVFVTGFSLGMVLIDCVN